MITQRQNADCPICHGIPQMDGICHNCGFDVVAHLEAIEARHAGERNEEEEE